MSRLGSLIVVNGGVTSSDQPMSSNPIIENIGRHIHSGTAEHLHKVDCNNVVARYDTGNVTLENRPGLFFGEVVGRSPAGIPIAPPFSSSSASCTPRRLRTAGGE